MKVYRAIVTRASTEGVYVVVPEQYNMPYGPLECVISDPVLSPAWKEGDRVLIAQASIDPDDFVVLGTHRLAGQGFVDFIISGLLTVGSLTAKTLIKTLNLEVSGQTTLSGQVNMHNLVRLYGTGTISSLTSTTHPFQIGSTSSGHLAVDANRIQARNNGSVATLALNSFGGDMTLGNAATNITVPGKILLSKAPTGSSDATRKDYVDSGDASILSGAKAYTDSTDSARKSYIDKYVLGGSATVLNTSMATVDAWRALPDGLYRVTTNGVALGLPNNWGWMEVVRVGSDGTVTFHSLPSGKMYYWGWNTGTTTVDFAPIPHEAFVKSEDTATLNAAKSYTDSKDSTQKSYIDSQDTSTLNSAKSYTDTKDNARKTYVDSQDTATLNSAKTYTDDANTITIPGGTNLNDWTKHRAVQRANVNATLALNYPVPYAGELLTTIAGDMTYQQYTVYQQYPGQVFTRQKYVNNWSAWSPVISEVGGKTNVTNLEASTIKALSSIEGQNLTASGNTTVGGVTTTNRLIVQSSTDIPSATPPVSIGAPGASRIEIDTNEIISLNADGSGAELALNGSATLGRVAVGIGGFYVYGGGADINGELTARDGIACVGNMRASGRVGGNGNGVTLFSRDTDQAESATSANLAMSRDSSTSPQNANLLRSVTIYNRTYTGAANMYITGEGTLGRTTSRRDSKDAIEDAPSTWADKLLNLRPRTWFDRGAGATLANLLEREAAGEEIDWSSEDIPTLVRIPGFVAEEVEEVGLKEFVTYDKDGDVSGVAYDRIPAALVMLAQRQQTQINELQQENDVLKSRLDALEALVNNLTSPTPEQQPTDTLVDENVTE